MATWQAAAESQLNAAITDTQHVGGGDFAQAFKATLSTGQTVFIKTHSNPPPGFFSTEAQGLEWLRTSGQVNVPSVMAYSDTPPFLAMEWIDLGYANTTTEHEFGNALAHMHQLPFACFGRPDKKTTGSQAVPNTPCDSWAEFYASQRLLPLAKLAKDKSALPDKAIRLLEQISQQLPEFGAADEAASLLHGDLWAGNRVVDKHGHSWLIDPAAHGGHREFDLAMMRLFGGYGEECFDAYSDVFPLQPGWQSRVSLHQLAPLTVHAIKFGGHYRSATLSALEQYS
jgi:fructosamine-3-kinase